MQQKNSDGPSLVLKASGYPVTVVRPGDILKIGRDRSSDLALSDPTVSRSHATVAWDIDSAFPRLFDTKSTSGTKVDGHIVKYKHLTSAHTVQLGGTRISAEYVNTEALVPTRVDLPTLPKAGAHALLFESDDDNKVTLFKEYGSTDEAGAITSNEDIHSLLKSLEAHSRTGTLYLWGTFDSWILFAVGKIKQAKCGDQMGEWALQTIASMPNATYKFSVECDVGEAPLNISVACYLRALRLSSTQRRSRRYDRKRIARD